MTLLEKQTEFVEKFNQLADWFDKYDYLILLGSSLEPFAETKKNEEYKLKSCQSNTWACVEWENECLHLTLHSEAMVSQGILSLLPILLNGYSREEIAATPFFVYEKTELLSKMEIERKQGLHEILSLIY